MNKQKGLSPIAIVVIIAFVLGGYLYFQKQDNLSLRTDKAVNTFPNLTTKNTKEKTYINDFYHIRFDIPSDWKAEDSTRNDGWPLFKLSSSNQEIIIQNFTPNDNQDYLTIKDDPSAPDMQPDRSNYLSQKAGLKERKVMLGSYEVGRFRYFNKSGSVTDSISLYNIPRQKVVTLYFTANGDFESNNKKLLEILKTFAFTQPEPSLDEFISYSVPPNWNKDYKQYFSANSDPDKYIYLTSPDAHYNGIPFLDKGAEIFVNRNLKDPSRTFKDQVRVEYSKEMIPTKISNLEAISKPT